MRPAFLSMRPNARSLRIAFQAAHLFVRELVPAHPRNISLGGAQIRHAVDKCAINR
ncbi:MAG TPA: hypothetical protein VKB46_15870 [Pyrinomonadaceae bacterium]|nr:hypothetical protein [Pyrinomonadaceae bacterium]